MRIWVFRVFLAGLSVLAAGLVRADTVYLKNGREMEGLVSSETRSELVLDIGYGTVTLQKADIARVKRAAAGARQALLDEQQEKYIESGQSIPPGGEEAFRLYKKAGSARDGAREAQSRRRSLLEDQQNLEGEIDDLKHQISPLSEELNAARAYRGSGRYNKLVADLNAVHNKIITDQVELEDAYKKLAQNDGEVQEYLSAFSEFKRYMRARGAPASPLAPAQARYWAALERAYRGMDGDFAQEEVGSLQRGSHVVVKTTLNDKVVLRLMVDTGASMTMISPAAAQRLDLDENAWKGTVNTMVADGRVVSARVAVLDSLVVGSSRVEKSPVAVLDAALPGVDGLLGMSFLKNFVVSVDGKTNTLLLQRLK